MSGLKFKKRWELLAVPALMLFAVFLSAGQSFGGTNDLNCDPSGCTVGTAITLGGVCQSGQVLVSSGSGSWACGTVAGSGGGTITGVTAGSGLTGGGATGNVTLSLTSCTQNQILKSSGAGWQCSEEGVFGSTGNNNTAIGQGTLMNNQSGTDNTANGYGALMSNTTGGFNTANGVYALGNNQSGTGNTASGYSALGNNRSGTYNTANGYGALYTNTSGHYNTAIGREALYLNTGHDNVAIGEIALRANTSGYNNIAIGSTSGNNIVTGNNNIYIGSFLAGSGDETGVIRIGNAYNAAAYSTSIAGIYGGGVGSTFSAVYVDSTGKLGVGQSSRRFKEDIKDMGDTSSNLMKLRPVTFHYKPEIAQGDKNLQYGLIAEEVAEVYPELVQYDKEGKPYNVSYHLLNTMLLNEAQKQKSELAALQERLSRLEALINK